MKNKNLYLSVDHFFGSRSEPLKIETLNHCKVYSSQSSTDKIDYREFQEESELGQIKLLKGFVSYLLQHLNDVTGRSFDMNTYFS